MLERAADSASVAASRRPPEIRMLFARFASFAVALALTACAQPPAPSAPAPVSAVPPVHAIKDFFRSSPKAFFRLSEDGSALGFMQPTGDARRYNIFVQPLDGSQPRGEARQVTQETARSIDNYFWKGNRTVLYSGPPPERDLSDRSWRRPTFARQIRTAVVSLLLSSTTPP